MKDQNFSFYKQKHKLINKILKLIQCNQIQNKLLYNLIVVKIKNLLIYILLKKKQNKFKVK